MNSRQEVRALDRGLTRLYPARIAAQLAWLTRLAVALLLFIGALQVMKTGAQGFDVLNGGGALVRDPLSTLGLGWLGALLVLSGSPIAASALSLVAGGSISEAQGFTMLTGSRIGAAFVVLLVGVVYALRGGRGQRHKPVSTAVIALCVTAFVYIPGAVLGYALLQWGPFRALEPSTPPQLVNAIDLVYEGVVDLAATLPPVVAFLGGLLLLLVSLKLVDSVIPELGEDSIERSWAGKLRRKWPMFALGCLVALISMSVSVALTVLVPLVARNVVRREDIVPYIMGANIATLGDTLLAAFLLGSPEAVRIVLAGISGVAVVSVAVLAFAYEPLRAMAWRSQHGLARNKTRLAYFTAALFGIPIAMIGASWLLS